MDGPGEAGGRQAARDGMALSMKTTATRAIHDHLSQALIWGWVVEGQSFP
jgi:hypothetical protein